ncbi:MAG: alginate export family protein [Siphonobacter aquaeclarae]|nr:alginate export family protein [Siphonobacter aquaeclarae]
MIHNYKSKWGLAFGGLLSLTFTAKAQVTLTGQIRTRTELRQGYATLLPKGASAAAFTSQRSGISLGYRSERIRAGVTLRDVRVWGQDASSISPADGNRLFLHEAWGEFVLSDSTWKDKLISQLSLKVGRQELVYDDVRLLGNLDWLQQGRRFDAAVLKAGKGPWQFDLGIAFNQNSDAAGVKGTFYTPGNVPAYVTSTTGSVLPVPAGFVPTSGKGGAPQLVSAVSTNGQTQQFKSLQYLYAAHRWKTVTASGLLFKDDFQKYRIDSIGSQTAGWAYGRRYDVKGVNSRFTYGAMVTGSDKRWQWQAFAYGQSGHTATGQSLSASYWGVNASIRQGKWWIGPGFERLSGNNTLQPDGKDHRFDPLYGTPHKHWGYMDYFYVATGAPAGGLNDAFLKARYLISKRFTATLDIHHFSLASPVRNTLDGSRLAGQLGQEIDLVVTGTVTKYATLEAGYSWLRGTDSLEYVKLGTAGQASHQAQWAYLMLNLRPEFLH